MKKFILSLMFLAVAAHVCAGPVIRVCNGGGSTNVAYSIEYSKPYWTVSKGNSTTNRIFRYDEGTRRIQPISGSWIMELKTSTPNRLVDRSGKVILEYRDGNIYKPGNSSIVATLQGNALYGGNGTNNCLANFRNGTPPAGVALAIAAQYYIHKDLGYTPKSLKPANQASTKLYILSIPFDSKENKTVYTDAQGNVLYTFYNGFIFKGDNLNQKALYAVAIGEFALVGKKKKKTPYIINFHDLHNPHPEGKPDYVFQSIVRNALFKGDSIKNPPLIHLGGKGEIFAGSLQKEAVGHINPDGSQIFRGPKPEGTPVLNVSGNRYNHWVEMFIWAKVLQDDVEKYLEANPDANVPFPAKK